MTAQPDWQILHGDCREAVGLLNHKGPFDLVVMDPPYRLTTGGRAKSGKTMRGIFAKHNYDNRGDLITCNMTWAEIMAFAYDALKDDGEAYVMANDKNLYPALDAAFAAGFRLHNVLVWDKVSATANRWYMKNVEFTLYLWRGRARRINNPGSMQGVRGPQIDTTAHPTEKPVWLMRHYIENSSQPGDIVLDPFMGSGTTGVAAIEAGRRFAGVEIDVKFYDMACKRLGLAGAQGDLLEQSA